MLYITWFNWYTGALACVFFTVVHTGRIENYSNKGTKEKISFEQWTWVYEITSLV